MRSTAPLCATVPAVVLWLCACGERVIDVGSPTPDSTTMSAETVAGTSTSESGGPGSDCPAGEPCSMSCAGGRTCGAFDCGSASTCDVECTGNSTCIDVACGEATACTVQCMGNATCAVACEDAATCTVDCSGSSQCEIDCTAGGDCSAITCTSNGGCLLTCGSPEACAYLQCPNATVCDGGVVACNRACP